MIVMSKNCENLENLRRYSHAFDWTYKKENGLAIISLTGPTMYADSWYFSNAAYLNLRANVEMAVADDEVKEIAVLINSPGGDATGLVETAEWLHAQTGKKPIFAFTDSLACSAAYLLGSACTAFYSSRYAELGCCGVMAVVQDVSEAEKKYGIFTRIFRSKNAAKKNLSPLTEEGAAALQKDIDTLEDGYFSALEKFRGEEKVSSVKTLEGGTVLGEEAFSLGLTDGVYTYEEFIALITEGEGDNEEMSFEEMDFSARQEAFNALCSLSPELVSGEVERAITAERERVSSLLAVRKAYNAEAVDKAITEGRTREEISNELLTLAEAEATKNAPMAEIAEVAEAQQTVKTPVAEETDKYLAAAEKLNKEK